MAFPGKGGRQTPQQECNPTRSSALSGNWFLHASLQLRTPFLEECLPRSLTTHPPPTAAASTPCRGWLPALSFWVSRALAPHARWPCRVWALGSSLASPCSLPCSFPGLLSVSPSCHRTFAHARALLLSRPVKSLTAFRSQSDHPSSGQLP